MPKPKNIGDILILPNGIETIVLEVDEDSWPSKVVAVDPDPCLGRIGWFLEGEDWVQYRYSILTYN